MADKVTIQIIFDEMRGRTNLAFSGKPSEEIRNEMKASGWRWSSRNKVWYPRRAEGSTEFAHQLQEKYFADQNEQTQTTRQEQTQTQTTVQSKFDNALDAHKAGQLPDGYVFNLGKPGEILQKCGFPEHHNIELSASHLKQKMNLKRHLFTEDDIKGLDKALQNPVAVFEYGDRTKSQNVIVELQKDGKNFLAGVHFNQKQRGLEVSDIRGLFQKDNIEWLRWIEQGKMIYGDKEKIQVLASQQRMTFAEVAGTDARSSSDTYYLDSVDNILQEFGDVKQIFTDDFSDYKKYKERFEVYKALDNYYREYPFDRELIHEQTNEFYEAWKNKDIQTLHKYWVKENDLSETVRTFLVNNDKEIVDNMAFFNYVANGKIQEDAPQEQIQLTEKDLALAKQIIPPNQYTTTLELTQGEDGDFFKRKIHEVAQIAERLYSAKKTNVNKYGTHPLELHYFDSRSNSDWYINELTDAGTAFGYAIINGDTQMAEWGYIDINEIFEACPYVELDYQVPEGMTIEQAIKKEQTKTQEQSTETAQNDNTIKYTVYHIKDGDEYFYLRNRSYEDIPELGLRFDKNNYKEVYHGEIPVSDDTVVGEGDMYFPAAKLNNDEYIQEEIARRLTTPPADYPLPFLILGDVVVYEVDGVRKAFYVDAIGMTMNDEITRQFVTETQEQTADPKITKGTAKKIREQCRQILQKPDSEITEADKQILASYEGAGGLHEENQSASGVLSEFYTPQNIIDATWQLVDYYAPDAKTVLEPSAGTGRFARGRDDKEFTMHELDETSARIAKLLHPDANVIVGAYQKQFFDENERVLNKNYEQPKYDIVIGNPPYGDYKDKYKGLGEGKDFDRYEEYFISKGLDSLKDENSILAMVVPSGFLNSAKDKQKEIIAEKGVLLDAYRLPEGAFPSTQVGTDIVIFQKTNNKLFEQTGDRTLLDIRLKNISDNNYFTEFPQNILGEERIRINRFGREETYVALPEGKTIDDMLAVITQDVEARSAERATMREQFNNMGKEFGEAINKVLEEEQKVVEQKDFDDIIYSSEFIEKFGDWEKAQRLEKLKNAPILEKDNRIIVDGKDVTDEISLLRLVRDKENVAKLRQIAKSIGRSVAGEYLNKDSNQTIVLSMSNIDEIKNHHIKSYGHLEAIQYIPEIIREGIFISDEANTDKQKHPNIERYKYLVTGIKIDDTDFTCKSAIAVDKDGKHYYDQRLSEIEKGLLLDNLSQLMSRGKSEQSLIEHDMRLLRICQCPQIEYLDKNLQPTTEAINAVQNGTLYIETDANGIQILHDTINDRHIGKEMSEMFIGEQGTEILQQTVQNAPKLSESVIAKPATTRTEQTEKPARRKTYQKETVRIKKSKGEVMSAKEFSRLYNKDIDERELPIWRATDWEGNIDTAKLSKESLEFMKTSGSYSEVDFRNSKWQHNAIFLSGDIQKKIDDQKEMLEKAAAAEQWVKDRIEKNIANLENVIPNQLSMDNIHIGVKTNLAENFTVGSVDADGNPVEINLQEAFIYWAQGTTAELQTSRHHIDWVTANVSREELPTNVTWNDIVEYIDGVPVRAQATRYSWGSESKDELKAKRAKEADEKRAARRETADKLFDRFLHEGLGENDKRRFVSEYNKMFNSYVAPDYSKLPLAIEGMSAYKGDEKFRLYDQQIQGVSFLCNKGNGLLAYDVGLGKTACGIVATVNQIQTGRAERPLIVVPNAVYAKWLTDIHELFPNVKVNDLYNLNSNVIEKYKGREAHSLNIEKGSVSLCTYEALQNMTFTDKSCSNELFEDFQNLLSVEFDGGDRKKSQAFQKIKEEIGNASHVKDENYVFFENCGFDNLTVDEAHNFKNLWVVPKPKEKGKANEFSGIPSGSPSSRAKKMFAMTQLVQRHNNNRNVFMLSATPFTNSPVEVYSMMSYIGRERLKASGLNSLADFMNMYANTKNELGVNTKGEIAYKQVMKNWKELPPLQNLLTEFIDKRDCEEANIVRPYKTQKKVEIEMTDLQKKIIAAETERIYENKNPGDTLVAMNNMRLALVSPTLLDASNYTNTDIEIPSLKEFVGSSPKLKFVCDSIIDMYKQHPDKGQFMYMPLGKTGHSIVKDYLMEHGIPKDAVEIISGEVNNTPEKKEKITSKFNDANNKLKIIIGGKNTSEGIDLNGNSFVMYNCSLGWNPSETEQAEGRIWRQGNRQGQVYTVYPIMYDSIDSLLFQKHDEKMSRINELWTYKGDTMNVEGLKPEELKFDLIKDPSHRAKLILDEQTKELKAELAKAELKQITFDELRTKSEKVKADILDAKNSIEYYQKNGAGFAWQQERIKKNKKDLKKFELQEKTVKEKLNAMGLTSDEKIAEHGMRLANEKKLLEEQIENKVKEMPEIIKQMKTKQLEQNLLDRPFEETRKEFVSSVASNLRSMQDVENEIRTERHEKMLAEKLEKGEISNDERDVFSKVGWKNYRQFTEGEISFDELKNPNHTQKENITVDKNEQASKKTDIEQKLQDVSPTNSVDENGQGNLFNFICAETSLNNDATYKVDKYRGNPLDPSITRDGINEAKAARARHTKEVLTGEQKCLWKCFKDFKTHNVFDIQGKKIEFDKDGKMSETSWKQLKAAMDIYRDKRFESFRYLLIDKETGQVRDQLALAVKMPHISFADAPDKSTTKKVLERAEKNNCFIVAVHNHPSGDIEPSPQDIATTKILENAFTPEGGTESLLKGHIILDHDTFSLYTKETGWTKCDSEKQLGYDPIGNELPEWAKVTNGGISNDVDLLKIAESINDYYEWHKDYVPFIFTSNPTIMAVQYYHVDFIANRDELVNGRRTVDWIVQDAKDMGATNIFPIITEDLKWKMEKDHILEIDKDGTIYADNPALERLVHEFHFDNTMRGSSVVTDGIIGKETFVKYTRSLYPNEDLFYDDRKRDNISIKETSTWDNEIEHKTNDKSNRKEIER